MLNRHEPSTTARKSERKITVDHGNQKNLGKESHVLTPNSLHKSIETILTVTSFSMNDHTAPKDGFVASNDGVCWPWPFGAKTNSDDPGKKRELVDLVTHKKRLAQLLRYISSMAQNNTNGQTHSFVRALDGNMGGDCAPFFCDDHTSNSIVF